MREYLSFIFVECGRNEKKTDKYWRFSNFLYLCTRISNEEFKLSHVV